MLPPQKPYNNPTTERNSNVPAGDLRHLVGEERIAVYAARQAEKDAAPYEISAVKIRAYGPTSLNDQDFDFLRKHIFIFIDACCYKGFLVRRGRGE